MLILADFFALSLALLLRVQNQRMQAYENYGKSCASRLQRLLRNTVSLSLSILQ